MKMSGMTERAKRKWDTSARKSAYLDGLVYFDTIICVCKFIFTINHAMPD